MKKIYMIKLITLKINKLYYGCLLKAKVLINDLFINIKVIAIDII